MEGALDLMLYPLFFCKSGNKLRQMMFYTSHEAEFRRGISVCWFCIEYPQYSILRGNSEEELVEPPSTSLQGCLRQSLAWRLFSFLSREIPSSVHVVILSAESYISIQSEPPTIPVSLGLRSFLGYWTSNAAMFTGPWDEVVTLILSENRTCWVLSWLLQHCCVQHCRIYQKALPYSTLDCTLSPTAHL